MLLAFFFVAPAVLAAAFGAELRAAAFVGTEQASRPWALRLDAHTDLRRNSHDLEQCSDWIGLLLEPGALTGSSAANPPLAIDIMNPCWIYPKADMTGAMALKFGVGQIPFNFQIGADRDKIPCTSLWRRN